MASGNVTDNKEKWSANTTRMLIDHYKVNSLLWDQNHKKYGNKGETKKALAPLVAKLEKSNPPRAIEDIKKRWHNLRSSVLRYMKNKTDEPVQWAFWEDMAFLRNSLEMHDKTKQSWSSEDTESLINFYQENESLWNHNIADYHQDSNKDLLYDTLIKILDDRYSAEEIKSKWKELINLFKQEYAKASHKPSGSGTNDIYKSSWEFFEQLKFVTVVCDDTDNTVDTLTKAPKIRKLSKQQEQKEREDKKLQLFEQAVHALKAPEPAPAQQPTRHNEAAAFANCVRLTLDKFTPRQFRRAKKCISDILYQIEESSELENMSSSSTPYSDNQSYSPASPSTGAHSLQYQQMASYTQMPFPNF